MQSNLLSATFLRSFAEFRGYLRGIDQPLRLNRGYEAKRNQNGPAKHNQILPKNISSANALVEIDDLAPIDAGIHVADGTAPGAL
jgi:hypothetical protein